LYIPFYIFFGIQINILSVIIENKYDSNDSNDSKNSIYSNDSKDRKYCCFKSKDFVTENTVEEYI